MSFQTELETIFNQWARGRITKVSAVVEFQALLHNYGLLPEEEEIDLEISDRHFAVLLQQAYSLKGDCLTDVREHQMSRPVAEQQAAFEGKVLCPKCHKSVAQIFNEIKLEDGEHDGSIAEPGDIVSLDPPRCESCAQDYVDEVIFSTKRPYIPDTQMAPMSDSEENFFRHYEQEMQIHTTETLNKLRATDFVPRGLGEY